MVNKQMENYYRRVSTIKEEDLRRLMIYEVGEKSKDKLYNYLKDLVNSYPKFDDWYYRTVIPHIESRSGEREIIICISNIEDSNRCIITGIAILKKTVDERKICTFRIHEDYRKMGIGSELFEECFKYLETRMPIITVSQDRINMFHSHIDKYGFKKTQELANYYTDGSIEYVYNGKLK